MQQKIEPAGHFIAAQFREKPRGILQEIDGTPRQRLEALLLRLEGIDGVLAAIADAEDTPKQISLAIMGVRDQVDACLALTVEREDKVN